MAEYVDSVVLRGIFDSRRNLTVEAEIRFDDGATGVASAPVAIAPGRRERARVDVTALGALDDLPVYAGVRDRLTGAPASSQKRFDEILDGIAGAGVNVQVALSMAFARARCASEGVPLSTYISGIGATRPKVPSPLVNVFSGGIHSGDPQMPFQEIMVAPAAASLPDNLRLALAVYEDIESLVRARYADCGYSSAGGLRMRGLVFGQALEHLSSVIERRFPGEDVGIGVDVAAEHLRRGGVSSARYAVGDRLLRGEELSELLAGLSARHPIRYLEDPFDPADVVSWKEFSRQLPEGQYLCGDDLFATDERRMSGELATCAVIKLTQCGTLTRGIRAARAARRMGMALCVSHRSGETEDCGVCDLAVGLAAEFIKVGGPSADRMAKYNQLVRLEIQLREGLPVA
ncbi:hypothetical protein [Amycolatopsis sp. MtRt-6]|uniref:hypothetical protein n=1 Tax=Amycolatopsis sp. MtRt-6 TaxID=2792782 RepID=UPI001A8F3CA9|nr:hypothetical protein [Amycolatopsis sp. MtRt-6]